MSTVFNTPDMYPAVKRWALAAVPNAVAEIVSTKNCYILQITVHNPTGVAVTITVADRQFVPVALLNAVSFAANSAPRIYEFEQGVFMNSGFTLIASLAGLIAEVVYRESTV